MLGPELPGLSRQAEAQLRSCSSWECSPMVPLKVNSPLEVPRRKPGVFREN